MQYGVGCPPKKFRPCPPSPAPLDHPGVISSHLQYPHTHTHTQTPQKKPPTISGKKSPHCITATQSMIKRGKNPWRGMGARKKILPRGHVSAGVLEGWTGRLDGGGARVQNGGGETPGAMGLLRPWLLGAGGATHPPLPSRLSRPPPSPRGPLPVPRPHQGVPPFPPPNPHQETKKNLGGNKKGGPPPRGGRWGPDGENYVLLAPAGRGPRGGLGKNLARKGGGGGVHSSPLQQKGKGGGGGFWGLKGGKGGRALFLPQKLKIFNAPQKKFFFPKSNFFPQTKLPFSPIWN